VVIFGGLVFIALIFGLLWWQFTQSKPAAKATGDGAVTENPIVKGDG
jgi:hypothetical protein